MHPGGAEIVCGKRRTIDAERPSLALELCFLLPALRLDCGVGPSVRPSRQLLLRPHVSTSPLFLSATVVAPTKAMAGSTATGAAARSVGALAVAPKVRTATVSVSVLVNIVD